MLLTIILIYLGVLVSVMLVQFYCYKMYWQSLHDPHKSDLHEVSAHIKLA